MTEFPGNSSRQKREEAKAQSTPEEKKVERVTASAALRRKKPLRRRMSETLTGDDARSVWGYVLFDVLIPAAKDMIADAGSQGLERLLFGETHPRSRRDRPRGGTNLGHVAYNRYGTSNARRDEPRRDGGRRSRAVHDFDDIILPNRVEAEEVIDRLFIMVDQYDMATVADLYDLVGLSGNFVDQKWGWTDMRGAGVSRVRDGYLLNLPKPEPLD